MVLYNAWHRCESANWDREWSDAARSQWSGEGLSADLKASIPANGGSGGTEHIGDHLRKKEQSAGLLPVLAEVENPPHGWGE